MNRLLLCLILFATQCQTADFKLLSYFDDDWDVGFFYQRNSQKIPISISGSLSRIATKKHTHGSNLYQFSIFDYSESLNFLKKNIGIKSVSKDTLQISITYSLNDDDNDDNEVYEEIDMKFRGKVSKDLLFNLTFPSEKSAPFTISIPKEDDEKIITLFNANIVVEEKNLFYLSISRKSRSSHPSSHSNHSSSLKASSHLYDILSFFDASHNMNDDVVVYVHRKVFPSNFESLPMYLLFLGCAGYFIYQARGMCFKEGGGTEDDVYHPREGGGGSGYQDSFHSLFSNLFFSPSPFSSSPFASNRNQQYTYTNYQTTTRITEIVEEEEETVPANNSSARTGGGKNKNNNNNGYGGDGGDDDDDDDDDSEEYNTEGKVNEVD